ncbi:MAG: acyl-CoA dehydrogenase C-terminal domain-containing protein [Aestuariivita sp.]|nr:acyl-CoA dehydrogenase C-terminal domain-containing protein [Aestuariivita sp.]
MPLYRAPTKDMQFLLHDVFSISAADILGYRELDPEFTNAIITEAGKLATEVLHPLNKIGDQEGCQLNDGVATTPTGFKDAFDQLKAGGWTSLDMPSEFGGQNIPYVIHTAVSEIFSAANQSLAMYQALTHGAAFAILTHGSEEQKQTYLPPMISCNWTGTMNLTEPHCGTDLGLIRTQAIRQSNDTYKITGQKIFISSGEHDLAENIIHLVLARISNAPKGIKGVSLFIVPKILPKEDGTLGSRNTVRCDKIEKKMGIHGNSTCVMNYDNATGYLLGEPHKGMRAMFTMMNEARLGVGLQGYAQAEVAYQYAVDYAKERLQGRDITGTKAPEDAPDPIIVHPDVRRSLMDQKSFIEGARAFVLWGATLIDRSHRLNDTESDGLISLLTPVIKGFLTDQGHAMTIQAQQIFGGHGYIEEWGMSQFVRDARITMIYEGANGVQALDLVGRKLAQDGGKNMKTFLRLIDDFINKNTNEESQFLQDCIDPLSTASKHLKLAVQSFHEKAPKHPYFSLAGSSDFMHLFGHVCLGFMWAKIATAAQATLNDDTTDIAFYNSKLVTARYYMTRCLAATSMHLKRIQSGEDLIMALSAFEL